MLLVINNLILNSLKCLVLSVRAFCFDESVEMYALNAHTFFELVCTCILVRCRTIFLNYIASVRFRACLSHF